MLPDTTPEARRIHYELMARMTPAQRVAMAMEMCAAADQMQRAAIRRRKGDLSHEELCYELLKLRYGAGIAERVRNRCTP